MDKSKFLNQNIRNDFPILSKKILEKNNLVYFDTAASSQKPNTVINETNDFYQNHYYVQVGNRIHDYPCTRY